MIGILPEPGLLEKYAQEITFSPEYIEAFADLTCDGNEIHKAGNPNQIAAGTHLRLHAELMARAIKEDYPELADLEIVSQDTRFKAPITKESEATLLPTNMQISNGAVRINYRVCSGNEHSIEGAVSLASPGLKDTVEEAELFSREYQLDQKAILAFYRHLQAQTRGRLPSMSDPEIPRSLITSFAPPAVLSWQKSVNDTEKGYNSRMKTHIYNPPSAEENLRVVVEFPELPRKINSHFFYTFSARHHQPSMIVARSTLMVCSPYNLTAAIEEARRTLAAKSA